MKKLLILFAFFLIGFAALFLQFFNIQVLDGEKWQTIAEGQHYFSVETTAKRGIIYSSPLYGKPLALSTDIEVFDLYADPKVIPKEIREEVVASLASLLHLTDGEIVSIRGQISKKSRRRKLLSWLDGEDKKTILQWWSPYAKQKKLARNGLFFESNFKRIHPSDPLLGQVLHTVHHLREEKSGKAQPTGGIEYMFDPLLQGKIGKRRYLRSPLNTFEIGETLSLPKEGADVYLTIHPLLQAIAEEEIAYGVKRCNAKRGWAIMMDPYTGKILALAQYPYFNLPLYPSYFSSDEKTEETRVKAIQDVQEPGSVMKPFTLATALLANKALEKEGKPPIFSLEEKIDTSNGKFPGRKKAVVDTHFHHYCNAWIGIQKSSNIYVATLATRAVQALGEDWYRNTLIDTFGFGKKTGIELPAEAQGLVPKPGRLHPNGALEWSKGTPASLAMGYNVLTTGLQLVRAYAIFANGGYLVKPTLIEKIENKEGDLLFEYEKDPGKQVLPKEICDAIIEAMKYTTKPGGTAKRAQIPGFTVAGKTSTAKKIVNGIYSETRYVPRFIGFTPVNNPAFVLLVTMDEPTYGYISGRGLNHHGGTASAPIFQRIARRSLEVLGRAPDDPFGYPEGDPRRDETKSDWMDKVTALQTLYDQWNGHHP